MDSKGEIKKRMISAAAKSWGISIKDMQKVDPLISLLIDACSGEIEKVYSSIEDSRDAMGNKLMELVTPESLLSPYPSRAILYAHPFDARFLIKPDHQFYFTKDNPFDEEGLPIEIFFTPLAGQMLINAELKYLAANSTLYHFETPFEKNVLCKSMDNKALPAACIWLGLSIDKSVESLDEVSFFFDLEHTNEFEEKAFYHALATSSWDINEHRISTKTGFEVQDNEKNTKGLNLPLSDFNTAISVSKHINNFYKTKFITLYDKGGITNNLVELTKLYPPIFKEVFMEEEIEEEMNGKFLWIRVDFTQHIPKRVFDNIMCSVNCIPIINRRAEHILINGRERVKGLNAEGHEQFFDLKSVSCDDKLKILFEKQSSDSLEGKALLTLRNDNIGRFNKRNALETIRHLNDVYYEEYAAFSKIKGIEHDHLDELNRAVRPFENIFEEMYQSSFNSIPCVMLKTEPENREVDVDVQYWLSNGALANGIKKGESLRFDSAELIRDEIYLISPSVGGTDQKRSDELINEFRYALLSHDRIASIEDIKALCYNKFGKLIDRVLVKKEIEMDPKPNSGLRRIILITIKLKKRIELTSEEIELLKRDIETELEEKSLNNIPFRVSIIE